MFCDSDEKSSPIMPIFAEVNLPQKDENCADVNPDDLPILTLRNMVLFPGVAMPVLVGREKTMQLVKEAQRTHKPIGVVCQVDAEVEDPEVSDLYPVGVVADVIKVLEMPDETTTVILQGRRRFVVGDQTATQPYLRAQVIKELTLKMLRTIGDQAKEMAFAVNNIDNAVYLTNFVCCNSPLEPAEKQEMLSIDNLKVRAFRLYEALSREAQLLDIKADIQSKTREGINQQQREHFLQQQIRTIQEELGGDGVEQEIQELRDRAEHKKWNENVAETFEKELSDGFARELSSSAAAAVAYPARIYRRKIQ